MKSENVTPKSHWEYQARLWLTSRQYRETVEQPIVRIYSTQSSFCIGDIKNIWTETWKQNEKNEIRDRVHNKKKILINFHENSLLIDIHFYDGANFENVL